MLMPRHGGSPPVAVSLADDRWQWLLATGIWHRQPICERGFGRARRLAAASMIGQCSLSLYFFLCSDEQSVVSVHKN